MHMGRTIGNNLRTENFKIVMKSCILYIAVTTTNRLEFDYAYMMHCIDAGGKIAVGAVVPRDLGHLRRLCPGW